MLAHSRVRMLSTHSAHFDSAVAASSLQPGMPKNPPLPKGHIDGLAKRIADDRECRDRILGNRTLLKWVSPQFTGVVGSTSLRLNVDLMLVVGSILCPQSSTPLALTVGPIKKQAPCFEKLASTYQQYHDKTFNSHDNTPDDLPRQPCRSSSCARTCTWMQILPACSARHTRLGHS